MTAHSKAAVETFPVTGHYDLAETLTSLGVGEAVVTALNARGVPTPVAATRIYPPASRMAPLTPAERAAIVSASPLRARYAERIDRESAEEILAARRAGEEARADELREGARTGERTSSRTSRRRSAPAAPAPRPDDGSLVDKVGEILGSRQGRGVAREVVRGIFGLLRRRR